MRYRFKNLKMSMESELHENKSSFVVFSVLRVLIVLVMINQAFNADYENVFLCLVTLVLLLVPYFVEVKFRVELPKTLEIIIMLFIFSAEILGGINEFYIKIPMWDTILHTLNGFLAAAVGFSLVYLLNRSKSNINLSPLFMAIVAFCFSMTVGVLWEFFEFTMDMFFGTDMQKDTVINVIRSVTLNPDGRNVPYVIKGITETTVNGKDLGVNGYLDIGLIDTMADLFVNFIGAITFSIFGFIYVKNRDKGSDATKRQQRNSKLVADLTPVAMADDKTFDNVPEKKKKKKNKH
ncbi:hypothetical protein [Aminicella lysinilytica]|uniref:Uncharacterized protein n=1 Tax=Aminicella lysinilytica TaxID=433323 RepID=A0A4V3CS54_9FIRM|nr:hypothetical protein [Aminicella lysinilytica]TDP59072.1 hypothetical protein EV211_1042 [Aminicella lysinilytica]